MKNNYFYLIFMILLLCTNPVFAGRCTGSNNCKACSTCSSCQYCNTGGSCGVCNSGVGFGKTIIIGAGILFVLWLFIDRDGNKNKISVR